MKYLIFILLLSACGNSGSGKAELSGAERDEFMAGCTQSATLSQCNCLLEETINQFSKDEIISLGAYSLMVKLQSNGTIAKCAGGI